MKNHGFLLSKNGWSLSPAHDINPQPVKMDDGLPMGSGISGNGLSEIMSFAEAFGVPKKRALRKLNEMKNTVEHDWLDVAIKSGINPGEADLMLPAFSPAATVLR